MIWKPICLGANPLPGIELEKDKKNCRKIGPCGVGKRALYLNSFYIDRQYYIPVAEVRRVFKRVAMSKGGFTGRGIFASIPYLVVQYGDGKEKQCNFKYEDQVDRMLEEIRSGFPWIPVHSEAAQKRLEKRERERLARKLPSLSEEAEETRQRLEDAKTYLEKEPELFMELSQAARRKRAFLNGKHTYKWVAASILVLGAASLLYGICSFAAGAGFAVYFTLFGLGAIFLFSGANVRPTLLENRRAVLERDRMAIKRMETYTEAYKGKQPFPIPARYAHPAVLKRMVLAVEERRAVTEEEALDAVICRLKALNHTVEVDEEEYQDVVAVKAMFLNAGYRKDEPVSGKDFQK